MQDIFNKGDNAEIINRIRKINNDSRSLWGKMSAAEMLFHCREPIRVSLGELYIKQGLIGKLFGKIALKQALSNKPFKKGVPTSEEFKPKGSFDLEAEKAKLIEIISSLVNKDPDSIGKNPHPFFGMLTPQQWSLITWKHLDHHLSQFGE